MVEWLQQLDLAILHQINSIWIAPWLDHLMLFIGSFETSRKIAIGLFIIGWLIFSGFKGRVFFLTVALAIGIGDAVVVNSIKKTVMRQRPHEAMANVRVVNRSEIFYSPEPSHWGGKSFPSGHAFNNFAVVLLATVFYGWRRTWFFYFWVFLVSYSRIYNGKHYPSDIIGSWLMALVFIFLLTKTLGWVWQRYGPRWFPQQYIKYPQLLAP